MSTYAYRWADGSVSVCSAKNKDEAAWLFDEIGPISRKLIVKLKSDILITVKPDIDDQWLLDDGQKFGQQIDLELQESCYPQYDKTCREVMEKLVDRNESLDRHPELRRKIEAALQRDVDETRKRMDKTPETPDIVLMYPKGLPGQNN